MSRQVEAGAKKEPPAGVSRWLWGGGRGIGSWREYDEEKVSSYRLGEPISERQPCR